MSYWYLIALIILIICYVGTLFLFIYFKNQKLTNLIFVLTIFVLHLASVLIIYLNVGVNDWNFQNTLPWANVSPFMFITIPLFYLLPKKIHPYYCSLLALLSVGMFLSPVLTMINNISRNYTFYVSFLLDYVGHLMLSLFGCYLIYTKQASLNVKYSLIGASFIVGVALIMLIVNAIFDTSCFGLNLNGNHNIYNQVLVSNSYLSALIYFVGLIGVLFLGYLYQYLLVKYIRKK